ncbi:Poly(A) RNA polymerase GLD2 [Amphibalanus amphitrite]|uniref:Poly(A) RNA polymerase GLD2 n=1 Tax=Amphibalanus amphitrite TaxID=1232801 RepID=A0A6A4WA95_AMPAM|nr:Poly(A) RNA polymerase GLD2 [Amphibalanus amphitrite]
MYRRWPQQWMVSQSMGLASPPPVVPYLRPGSAFCRPLPPPVSEMEMMNYLWQSVLRPRPGRRPPPAAAGRWEQPEDSAESDAGSRASSPPGGRRQGTKRGCSEPPSPPADQRSKRGRRAPDGASPEDTVSEQIKKIFESCRQGDAVYKNKLILRDKVRKVLRDLYNRCELHIVGSSCTGFACDTSDVDICLFLTEARIDQQHEATRILGQVERLLAKDPDYRMELIRAKVPILRFLSVSTGIQVDLNCNNLVGIRNTHLLQCYSRGENIQLLCYSRVDERVCPLIVIVKLWAQSHDINDACRSTLSSYSLVLMVIHFLQCGVYPSVLPNLQRMCRAKFRPGQPIRAIPKDDYVTNFVSQNSDSLGSLFLGFLRYYAYEFNFHSQVASVRTGSCLLKYQCRAVATYNNAPGMWKYVCVEEPFDLTNTARAVHKAEAFDRIVRAFVDSHRALSDGGRLGAAFGPCGRPLFDDPE